MAFRKAYGADSALFVASDLNSHTVNHFALDLGSNVLQKIRLIPDTGGHVQLRNGKTYFNHLNMSFGIQNCSAVLLSLVCIKTLCSVFSSFQIAISLVTLF